MKPHSDKEKKNLTGKFTLRRIDKTLFVYLVCLLWAIVFWILTVFSKEYTGTIAFNAAFINLPTNKILVKDLPSKVFVKVKASGFSLLGVQYSADNDTLFIDASNVKKQIAENNPNEVYYLLLNNQLTAMTEQLGGNMKIVRILPDTVTFIFDQISQKIVPVKANFVYSFAKQYHLSGNVKVIPSKILIKGPKSILNKIDFLETEAHKIEDIEATQKHIIPLKANNTPGVDYGISSIIAEIPVEKFTEGELMLPIHVKNTPLGFVAKTFPSQIKITYNVSLHEYEHVKAEQFSAEINLANDSDITNNRIRVKLTKQPEYVSKVKIINPQVEFIMRKL